MTGVLHNPYTGAMISFASGATAGAVQIDHVVALGDAWQTGAQQLTARQRVNFANDPIELLAVDQHSNEQKSESDAASWLPAAKGYRCAYVARQVAVKAKYHLWVTTAEKTAITRVLATCPDQTVPASGGVIALQPARATTVSFHLGRPPRQPPLANQVHRELC